MSIDLSLRESIEGAEPSPVEGALAFFQSLRDPLGTAERLKQRYGDVVLLRVGPMKAALLGHPLLVDEVLNQRAGDFVKDRRYRSTPRLLGEGILTTDGTLWRAQRRVAQPAFQKEQIDNYAPLMIECVDEVLASWRSGQPHNVHRSIMAMALAIVGRTLFGCELNQAAGEMASAFMVLLEHWNTRATSLVPIPEWVPTPNNVRFLLAVRRLEALLHDLIAARRKRTRGPDEPDDLLELLVRARDTAHSGITDAILRDEFVTMVLAGYETSANSIAWTLRLLAEHPEVEARVVAEIEGARCEDRPQDLVALPVLGAVVLESLRLYPPVWGFGREALRDTEVGGRTLERGTQVFVCPYLNHRDERFYEHPLRFAPERWQQGLARRLPPGAFIPFGRGARMCIGRSFAMLEAAVILSRILRRFKLRLVPNQPVVAEPGITLRPRNGLHMFVEARQ